MRNILYSDLIVLLSDFQSYFLHPYHSHVVYIDLLLFLVVDPREHILRFPPANVTTSFSAAQFSSTSNPFSTAPSAKNDEAYSFYFVRLTLLGARSRSYLLLTVNSNVMNGGPSILRKPGGEKSNLELVNSLRSNFLAAQQDYSPPLSATNGNGTENNLTNGSSHRPPSSIWTSRDGSDYYIPTIDWSLSGLAEERSQYDITVKLFYLPNGSVKDRRQHTRDAISFVLKELGVKSIDLLIISFPGMSFDGDCEWQADLKNSSQGNDAEEIATWPVLEELHQHCIVKKLGLAEYGSQKLARFLDRVNVRPQVDQINVKDCCNVPPPLVEFAKKENIELLTHNDCTDILPSGTLRELLGQGPNGAGVLADSKRGIDGMRGDLTSQWVVKYTAVVKDRGVIENKGYFAAAELNE